MKKMKSAVALLLCFVMLVSFAACGKKDKDTDPTEDSSQSVQQSEEKLQSLEEVGLSYKKLYSANKIDKLMEKFDVVTVEHESSSGSSFICQVFTFDGGIAYVEKNGEAVSGFIKGFNFVAEKDRVKAYCDVEKLKDGADFDKNTLVSDALKDKKLVLAEETGDSYKIKSLSEDKEKNGVRYFWFEKESLALTKITYENSVGNTESTVITYNGELESFVQKITQSFDGELKTVKIAGEISDGDSVTDISAKLTLPADWEYIPSSQDRIDYYMDEDFSKDYTYPGHGEDYTLYISNIFDDEDNGKK